MTEYWLDTNVFIQARNGPYGFDIAPGFWVALDQMSASGQLASSIMVYNELVDEVEDDLANWAKLRRSSGLFIQPSPRVQAMFSDIATYVHDNSNYTPNQVSRFLNKADPWLIAHAAVASGTVVTMETRVPASSTRVKIPNVCDEFGVRPINTYQMLRELGISLV